MTKKELKRCPKCKEEKNATPIYFPRSTKKKDGLACWCKQCKRKIDRIYSRKYRKENPEWKKEDNRRNKKIINDSVKRWQKKYPEKKRAHTKVHKAIREGVLKREPCVVCGALKVDGHHPDYSKPLEVIWLCHAHHQQIHQIKEK